MKKYNLTMLNAGTNKPIREGKENGRGNNS